MTLFTLLIPLSLPDEELEDETERFTRLYFEMQDVGIDPVVGVESTSAGDVWILEFGNDNE